MRFSFLDPVAGAILEIRPFLFGLFLRTLLVAGLPIYLRGAPPSVPGPGTSQVSVVDIIPESLSGETADDSEPNLAVNPLHPSQIAASALTRDPMGGKMAPIFISTNGGQTWSCRSVVPSPQVTCDITLRFGSSSDVLYVSALRNQIRLGDFKLEPLELVICRSSGFANAWVMDEVAKRQGEGIDQPYITATTAANQKDRVFVGVNDFNGRPRKKTATIDRSLDGTANSFIPILIESRTTFDRDGAEIRPAISSDGNVVYAAFNHVTREHDNLRIADVVVVRDDNGGDSTLPFTSLVDCDDGFFGMRVVKERTFAWDLCLGNDRLGGDLAIAVDPKHANTVYLAWSEQLQNQPTLHVKKSTDGGTNWGPVLRSIGNAKNPGLAINNKGKLGFLYQQVDTSDGVDTWMTKFERTSDDFKTSPNVLTLATFPVSEFPVCTDSGARLLLGDYLHLMSERNDFYGIFSSSNVPDRARFPCGVTFQRRKDFNSKKLLDLQGNGVSPSIDPFFFKVAE